MSQPVQFNVGGVRFFTTQETIQREPSSKLAALVQTPPGPDGCYFLDRDPKHFQLLLNWLRDGWCSIPQSIEAQRELSAEVKHYGLISMDLWLRSQSHAKSMSDAAAAATSPGGLGGGRWSSGGTEGLLGPHLRGGLGQGGAATAAATPALERPWSLSMGSVGGGTSSPYSAARPSLLSRGARSFGGGGGLSWAEQQQQQPELGGFGGVIGAGGGLGGLFGSGRASGLAATPGPVSSTGATKGMGQFGGFGSAVGGGGVGGARPWLTTPSAAATPLNSAYPAAPTPLRAPAPSLHSIHDPAPPMPTFFLSSQQPSLNPAPTPQYQRSFSARPPTAPQPVVSLPRPVSTPSIFGGAGGSHLNGEGLGQQGLITPGLMPTPYAMPSGAGAIGPASLQQQQQQQMQVMAPAGGAGGTGSMAVGVPGSTPAVRKQAFRDALQAATTPPPQPGSVLSNGLPSQGEVAAAGGVGTGSKWTAKYLKDPELHEVVNTLLELAFSGPHPALRAGKVVIHITPGPCDHMSGSSVIPGGLKQQLRGKLLAVRVHNMGSGWSCEFPIRPNCDVTLFDKFSGLAEMVQENWFVLCAILKDQFGVVMAEEHSATSAAKPLQMSASLLGSFGSSNGNGIANGEAPTTLPSRPSCQMCKRATLAITLHKVL